MAQKLRTIEIPDGYSVASWRRGFTFTWRDAAGKWHQATEAEGAPFFTVDALEEAMRRHKAARK